MARAEIDIKETPEHFLQEDADLTAALSDGKGVLIIDTPTLVFRIRLSEKETRALVLKFIPPIP